MHIELGSTEVKQKNTLSLAYLGDAVYESLVREYIMERSNCHPKILHRTATLVVCADAQFEALGLIFEMLTDEEKMIVRRGKNSTKHGVPKNSSPRSYRAATALEALFGFLFMTDKKDRIDELFDVISAAQLLPLMADLVHE